MNKIESRIIGYKVVKDENETEAIVEVTKEVMHESIKRPEHLTGSTYKIKTPHSDHAMYITINDMVLNEGTEFESKVPYEIFINSKNMENFQWILATTRLISAIWRKGGDATFLVDELRAVFDPKGGYYKRGGLYMPSIVAEIGLTIETHLLKLGLLEKKIKTVKETTNVDENPYPPGATLCDKCLTKALVVLDGCQTCLSCGDSKCG